jgi:hypothetical protein
VPDIIICGLTHTGLLLGFARATLTWALDLPVARTVLVRGILGAMKLKIMS